MIAKRVRYSGKVQGVGFCYAVKDLAKGFDVCGWIQNQEDGTVLMEVAGECEELEEFLREIAEESSVARGIQDVWQMAIAREVGKGFVIRS